MNTIINYNKLDKLEAVRGFAALYVVLHHMFDSGIYFFGINFSFLFRFGQEAVILFFILSGFVISYSFEKSINKSFSLFFTKRFMRIYLPLIIVCITHYLLQVYDKDEYVLIDGQHRYSCMKQLFMENNSTH
jgi:peptidoglycan/LPS O-acetylase OafA/YrhL